MAGKKSPEEVTQESPPEEVLATAAPEMPETLDDTPTLPDDGAAQNDGDESPPESSAPTEDRTPINWETEPSFAAIGVAPSSAQRQLAARIANTRLDAGLSRREAIGQGIEAAIEWDHRGGPANNYQ